MILFIVGKGEGISKTNKKAMSREAKDSTAKQKNQKKTYAKNTLPPKGPSIRSTPNN